MTTNSAEYMSEYKKKQKNQRFKGQIKDICQDIRFILKDIKKSPEIKLNEIYNLIELVENRN